MKKSIQEVMFIFLGILEIFCPFSFDCEVNSEVPILKLEISILN
jgi:hypothetical protein